MFVLFVKMLCMHSAATMKILQAQLTWSAVVVICSIDSRHPALLNCM